VKSTLPTIDLIPAFTDNYLWLISREAEGAWVVDPGDSKPVLDLLQKKNLPLQGVLLTHHHPDHDGGIPALREYFPDLRVLGSKETRSPHTDEWLEDDQNLDILGTAFRVIAVPGHTLDHLAFYSADLEALFCGDTLFAGGCGRVFEGTPMQMYDSLQKIASLPAKTRIYCAHEYTEANLRFALTVDPANFCLQERQASVHHLRQRGLPTVPSLLAEEWATNPFLRCHESGLQRAAQQHEGAPVALGLETFTILRQWKNGFR
jgi:hydroxyacylglutathione hydrolase